MMGKLMREVNGHIPRMLNGVLYCATVPVIFQSLYTTVVQCPPLFIISRVGTLNQPYTLTGEFGVATFCCFYAVTSSITGF
jgi:hypothetical protein